MDVCMQKKARSESTFADHGVKSFITNKNIHQAQGFDYSKGLGRRLEDSYFHG